MATVSFSSSELAAAQDRLRLIALLRTGTVSRLFVRWYAHPSTCYYHAGSRFAAGQMLVKLDGDQITSWKLRGGEVLTEGQQVAATTVEQEDFEDGVAASHGSYYLSGRLKDAGEVALRLHELLQDAGGQVMVEYDEAVLRAQQTALMLLVGGPPVYIFTSSDGGVEDDTQVFASFADCDRYVLDHMAPLFGYQLTGDDEGDQDALDELRREHESISYYTGSHEVQAARHQEEP